MNYKPFAIWLTGLPASGKTTIANLLAEELRQRNLHVQVLDSDRLREILTPVPSYSSEERNWLYRVIAFIGKLLIDSGANVIIAATAHRRVYRQQARKYIPDLIEIYVRCSLETCIKRDEKGIYKKALSGDALTVPGVQELYEEPEAPVIVVDTDKGSPLDGVQTVIDRLAAFERIPDRKEFITQI